MNSRIFLDVISGKQSVTYTANIEYHRQLTHEESRIVEKAFDELNYLLYKNDMLNDADYLKELAEEKSKLLALFGDRKIYVTELPNGYYDKSLNPWFSVVTDKGPVKIGWRKRVINIEWDINQYLIKVLATDICPKDQTTRGHDGSTEYIHAWGYEKAKKYLDIILK